MVCRGQIIEEIVSEVWKEFHEKTNRVDKFLKGKLRKLFRKELHRHAEEIVPNYNRVICSLSAEAFSFFFKPVVKNIAVEEKRQGVVKEVSELMKNTTVVMLPLHFTNLDSLVLGYIAYKLGLKIPTFAAGKNLAHGALSKFLIPRYNSSIIDRDLIQRDAVYMKLYLAYVSEIVKRKIPFLYFMQGGRTYNGEIGYGLQTGIFKELIREKRKKPDARIAIVGISTSYSFVPEARRLYDSYTTGKSARHANLVAEWFRAVRTFKGELPIYLIVHEPKKLDDYLNENGSLDERHLAEKIVGELGAAMKVLPVPLKATSNVTGKSMMELRDELAEKGANLYHALEKAKSDRELNERYEKEFKKVLDSGELNIFYANTIKHLFNG